MPLELKILLCVFVLMIVVSFINHIIDKRVKKLTERLSIDQIWRSRD